MKNLRLLWATTRRGARWGLLAGVALAAVYGTIYDGWLLYTQPRLGPTTIDEILLAIDIAIVCTPLGDIFQGMLIGAPAGALAGLVIGAATEYYFSRFESEQPYRLLVGVLAMLCVQVWAVPVLYLLAAVAGSIDDMVSSPYTPNAWEMVSYVYLPTALGSISAAALSRRAATWCINELSKGVIQDG